MRDLGTLLPEPARGRSEQLVETWQTNWAGPGESDEAATRISDMVDATRADVLRVLAELD